MRNVLEASPVVTTLESALSDTERDAENALAAAGRLVSALKAAHTAARGGDLKALQKAQETAREALRRAGEAVDELHHGWRLSDTDQEAHLASGAFTQELLAVARQAGLSLYEQDSVLACFPSLVKVQPRDRSVLIDRKAYRSIRPSHLVSHLAKIQKKAPKLNASQFLETLHGAWQLLNQKRGGPEKFVDIYRCLTLLPSFRQEYSQQEFVRDIYLLDAADVPTTKEGLRYRLHTGATGAKTRANLLIMVTLEGVERTYYGIEFMV